MPISADLDTGVNHAGGETLWDVVVIGAGPAGAIASRECAKLGLRTLLLDKAAFPRAKVCGCCLNASAMATLSRLGLAGAVAKLHPARIEHLELACGSARATLRVVGGVAVSRERLDVALIEAARSAGVEFRSEVAAVVGTEDAECARVRVSGQGAEQSQRALCVIVADGLAGTSLAERSEFAVAERLGARMGAATILEEGGQAYEAGSIWMTIGPGGYAGAVRLEDGRLNVACAFSPGFVKSQGGPGMAAASILRAAGMPRIRGLEEAKWRGTPGLTRRRCVESGRVLVIGDSAVYVEPFTGEGMAWAVACGEAVAPIAMRHVLRAGTDGHWSVAHKRIVRSRQHLCRVVSSMVRRPRLAKSVIRLLSIMPGVAGPVLRRVERPVACLSAEGPG